MFAMVKVEVREALSGRFFLFATAFLAAWVALTPRLLFVTFGEDERMVRETGFSALRLAALIGALSFGIPRGSDRGLEPVLLARPVEASHVVLGRALGALFVTLAMMTSLSVILLSTLRLAFPHMSLAALPSRCIGFWPEAAALLGMAAALGTALPRGLAGLVLVSAFALAHGEPRLEPLLPERPAAAVLAALGYAALAAALAETRKGSR